MKERILASFLDGRATAAELAADLEGAYVRTAHDVIEFHVEFMPDPVVVRREGMLRVGNAAAAGEIDPTLLEPVGDCLTMSERFEFEEADAELLFDVAHCWGSPEINYPLDHEHTLAFVEWLRTGRNPLE